jgi:branched-chain amino acid transport system permease protein
MLFLQLVVDGVVSGCAVGVVAVTFAYAYTTTGVFHVAHAGIYTLAGYIAWLLCSYGMPLPLALAVTILCSAALGALNQKLVHESLSRREASPLVQMIASLGTLAVMQNVAAIAFTPNFTTFTLPWRLTMMTWGPISLSYPQVMTVIGSIIAAAALMLFSTRTELGSRIRAVASNRELAEITLLQPYQVYVYVLAIASGLVAIPAVFVGVDQAMQPYTSILILLTAVIAVIAGGIGSLPGAFIVSIALSVLQSVVLAIVPGRWSIALTFGVFIIFILVKPTGLFRTRLKRAS